MEKEINMLFTRNPFKAKEQPRLANSASPLERAIAEQSAEWLEAAYPTVYDALEKELTSGKTIEDIQRMLRRIFGWDSREAFQLRILQAAEHIISEQGGLNA